MKKLLVILLLLFPVHGAWAEEIYLGCIICVKGKYPCDHSFTFKEDFLIDTDKKEVFWGVKKFKLEERKIDYYWEIKTQYKNDTYTLNKYTKEIVWYYKYNRNFDTWGAIRNGQCEILKKKL